MNIAFDHLFNSFKGMSYTSFSFFIFLTALFFIFYIVPSKSRYIVMAIFSGLFIISIGGIYAVVVVYATSLFAYVMARIINRYNQKWICILSNSIIVMILLAFKYVAYYEKLIPRSLGFDDNSLKLIAPVGISFYSLQLIAYISDVYRKEIIPEKNIIKFTLFITWFPHILQGPIARYGELSESLFNPPKFDFDRACFGLQRMIWGLLQKLLIADRAKIIVDEVFTNNGRYGSVETIYAAILFGIELYADFSGCANISIGLSEILGIRLHENFNQPYFSCSIREFWRKWHITLSEFLKDYIYIPIGGGKKGKIRKYINIMITFFISGLWHGVGNHYIVWGLMHGSYQVIEDVAKDCKNRIFGKEENKKYIGIRKVVRVIFTFIMVDLAWIMFRADSISHAFQLYKNILFGFDPWMLFNGELYLLGQNYKETNLLLFFTVLMFIIDYLHVKGISVRKSISNFTIVTRWLIYFAVIFSVILFGKYGYGYNASDFIYMNF